MLGQCGVVGSGAIANVSILVLGLLLPPGFAAGQWESVTGHTLSAKPVPRATPLATGHFRTYVDGQAGQTAGRVPHFAGSASDRDDLRWMPPIGLAGLMCDRTCLLLLLLATPGSRRVPGLGDGAHRSSPSLRDRCRLGGPPRDSGRSLPSAAATTGLLAAHSCRYSALLGIHFHISIGPGERTTTRRVVWPCLCRAVSKRRPGPPFRGVGLSGRCQVHIRALDKADWALGTAAW